MSGSVCFSIVAILYVLFRLLFSSIIYLYIELDFIIVYSTTFPQAAVLKGDLLERDLQHQLFLIIITIIITGTQLYIIRENMYMYTVRA